MGARSLFPGLSFFLLLSALLASLPAQAEELTLAVLPFEKGAGSEELAGLGSTFAGLVLADLDEVEGLVLVERERIDAILAEVNLGRSGLIDPATAQKLGRGLGARFLVTGTYAVVKEQLVLTARVIEVRSGDLRHTVKAAGKVDSFIDVEKDLALDLVEGLERKVTRRQQRAILKKAPTERFDAFVAYAEGVEATQKKDLERARSAYRRAVALDPGFSEARRALDEVGRLLERERAGAVDDHTRAALAMNERLAVLYAQPTVLEGTLNQARTVEMLMRWVSLDNQGRDCERYREMRAYLEHVDWKVGQPPKDGARGVLTYGFNQRAKELGLQRAHRNAVGLPRAAYESPSSRGPALFRSLSRFLFMPGAQATWVGKPGSGLVLVARRCFAGKRLLEELDQIKAELRRRGLGEAFEGRPQTGMTLEDWLDLFWLQVHARQLGAGPALAARAELLLERVHLDDVSRAQAADRHRHQHVLGKLDDVKLEATVTEKNRRLLFGHAEEELTELARAVKEGRESELVVDRAECRRRIEAARAWAASRLEDHERWRNKEKRFRFVNRGLLGLSADLRGPLEAFGCLKGVPGRFRAPSEAAAAVERLLAAPEAPVNDTAAKQCARQRATVKMLLGQLKEPRYPQAEHQRIGFDLVAAHLAARASGCMPPLP